MSEFEIINELESLADFVQALFPDVRIERQKGPDDIADNSFIVRFLAENQNANENATYVVHERTWQLQYFGTDIQDVLTKTSRLSKHSANLRLLIPIKDSLRYMRIVSFGASEPFITSNEIDGIMIQISTETREAKDQETFAKIAGVSTVIN
jgi:hypothetical protein